MFAAPPKFKVVALELKTVAVPVVVVVIFPPFRARLPADVIFPFDPVTEKLVPAILEAPREMPVAILASDTSIPVVNPPPPDEVILRPVGTVCVADWLSINTSWLGLVPVVPAALTKAEYPVDPSAVVTTKLELVAVAARVNAISLELLVVIVLPPLYAVCRVMLFAEHWTTWFDASRQSAVAVAVVRPLSVKNDVPEVFTVTLFPELGLKVEEPDAFRGCAFGTRSPPLSVARPETFKALLTVVVPVPAPREIVDAAPPILRVVALVLNRLAVVAVVVKDPPLIAAFPAVVMSPDAVIVPCDPVVVMLPEVVAFPFSSIVKVGLLFDSITRELLTAAFVSFITNALPVPWFVRTNEVWFVRPDARVNPMFLPSVVVIVLPPS